MGDHYFLVFFGRRRPSKPRNLQITTGDRYFLAFLEWEITIFLVFFGGDDPRNPKICKSQREITIFLLFWSGKSTFSCFFGGDDPRNRKSANHSGKSLFSWSGKSLFSCLFGGDDPRNPKICKSQREITIFLLFWNGKSILSFFLQATTLETKKSANHSGRSLFSCFFGVGNHFFLAFWAGDDPQNPRFSGFEGHRLPKKQGKGDFPFQKSKKIVISRCDLQISGFEGRRL